MSNCPSISISTFLLQAQRYKAFDEMNEEVALTPVIESLIEKFFSSENASLSLNEKRKLKNRNIFSIVDEKTKRKEYV